MLNIAVIFPPQIIQCFPLISHVHYYVPTTRSQYDPNNARLNTMSCDRHLSALLKGLYRWSEYDPVDRVSEICTFKISQAIKGVIL